MMLVCVASSCEPPTEAADATSPSIPTGPGMPPRYRIVDIGTLGGDMSRAYAINRHKDVVGQSKTMRGEVHAFLWHYASRSAIDLGTLGGPASIAYGINEHGSVVGSAQNENRQWHAFLWERGAMVDLGLLPAGAEPSASAGDTSIAYELNDGGEIVGAANVSNNFVYHGDMGNAAWHAILWSSREGRIEMKDLGSFGAIRARAVAVNESGEVAGMICSTGGSGKSFAHAVRWRRGEVTELERLPIGWQSGANAIDDDGNVVGFSSGDSTRIHHAARWGGRSAALTDLGQFADLRASTAFGTNRDGWVVGSAGASSGWGCFASIEDTRGERAFIVRDGPLVDLDTRVVDDVGWILQAARAIDDAGDIAGWGLRAGEVRAFLLVPTSP
jgi:probable HAF family extracellular repeat protein